MFTTPRNVLITGANSLVGMHLLDRLHSEPTIETITAPTIYPLPKYFHLHNPIVNQDTNLTYILPQTIDTVFCCIETASNTPERYFNDSLVLLITQIAIKLGAQHLLLVGNSYDHTQNRNQTLEYCLQKQGWKQITLLQPLINKTPNRKVTELLLDWITLHPGIKAHQLARAIWRLALEQEQGTRTIGLKQLKQLGRRQ